MRPLPEHLKKFVEQKIADLSSSAGDKLPYTLAASFGALLLYADIGGVIALKPSGEFVTLGHDNLEATPETDDAWKTTALVSGSEKYPELKELLPRRPVDAKDCAQCLGTGRIHGARCGACHSLGWCSRNVRGES